MECGSNICVAQIGLDGFVGGRDLQVNQNAVHEVDGAVDEAGVPDARFAHFYGQGRNFVVDESCLDGARFSGVDLEGVGLEQLGEAFYVGETPVGVAP